ncbi:Nucleotide-binding universal stress protein, UspA family [Natronorubrum sediminis]|uniref:Nucleotide-binding universal stress protein, UspA family n=1 Tax=Natronorubrum sediminis TaxID=640943 RepID=A0A1H6FKP3_9EURY|nr:universal stress protein [Natronorubrum sediminis]SEH11416.1 Nucleotide-binding universal stress protein, UspA family [Natronorubrum sediminis]
MYDTILVPTDGSDVAENAIDHAVDIAEKYDADVHALYVVDTSTMDITLGAEQVDRIHAGRFDEMPELEARARTALEYVAEQATEHGLGVTESIVGGQPHRQIAKYADDNGVNLIVMGSAGRGGVRRALLGSVAERTLRTTDIPVLVVDVRKD